jgi:hypothetical protein
MNPEAFEMADGGWQTRSVLECGSPLPLFNRCASCARNQPPSCQAVTPERRMMGTRHETF